MRSLIVMLRHWRFLLAAFALAAVIGGVFAALMPEWYKSSATFLPPQRRSGLLERLGAGGISSTLRSFGISGLGGEGEGYSYIAILESRSMGERMVEEFDLMQVYEISDGSMEKALKALGNNTDFAYVDDGRVIISVWDRDEQRAAAMANAYFRHLNEISTRLNSIEARHNSEFIHLRYTAVTDSLRRLERQFAAFQRRTNIYALEEQTKAAIEAAGELYAVLGMQKVRLGMLERTRRPDDSELQSLRITISELEDQVPGMGDNDLAGLIGKDRTDLGEEGLTYLRLYRDIEILSRLQGILLPLYQQARIEEQKDMQALVPLDTARAAERHDRPQRTVVALTAGFSILALAIVFVLLRERFLYYIYRYPDAWTSVLRTIGFRRSNS